jgi:hypothetical protein
MSHNDHDSGDDKDDDGGKRIGCDGFNSINSVNHTLGRLRG